jgi:hypothetical protein
MPLACIYEVFPLRGASCGSANLIIAFVNDAPTVRTILAHFGNSVHHVHWRRFVDGYTARSSPPSAYQELDSATDVLGFAPNGTTARAATLAGQERDATHVDTVYVYGRAG